jgi:hypothetical protein
MSCCGVRPSTLATVFGFTAFRSNTAAVHEGLVGGPSLRRLSGGSHQRRAPVTVATAKAIHEARITWLGYQSLTAPI